MQFTSFTCNIHGKCRETYALPGGCTVVWVKFSNCNLICLSRMIPLGFFTRFEIMWLMQMVARLLTCVQFSGSARQYFKFRVTSAQNHLGSELLLNNGTGVIFGVIHFSVSLLLSVGHPLIDCQNQMFMYPGSVTIKSISRGCRIG